MAAHVVEIIQKNIYSRVLSLQSPTLLKIKASSGGLHCEKNAKIWAFSDPYFPVYGQNVRLF